ncbi:MAG: histidinol-phosphate transaminase [candidate division WOR-3 bacterium]
MFPRPRPNIESIQPYKPGKPVEQVARELGLRGPIDKLASNENSLGPSPKALAALRRTLHEQYYYPEDTCYLLRERLAKLHKVPIDSVMVGNGSVELISAACLAYLEPGDEVVMSAGSFIMAKISARIMNARLVEVPTKDYVHDLDRILENITEKTKILYLDNPMNPLGTIVTKDKLGRFIEKLPNTVLTIVDNAYADYIATRKYPNAVDYVKQGRNVLALRTFSKAHGLAGLRIGYGIANPEIVGNLAKVRLPFNVNRAAQAAALAALDDERHVNRSRRYNEEGKKYLYRELTRLNVFHIPSYTNFVFMNFALDSQVVYEKLLRLGVITRMVKEYGFPNALRVTVGTMEQNRRFIAALGRVLKELQETPQTSFQPRS